MNDDLTDLIGRITEGRSEWRRLEIERHVISRKIKLDEAERIVDDFIFKITEMATYIRTNFIFMSADMPAQIAELLQAILERELADNMFIATSKAVHVMGGYEIKTDVTPRGIQ